MISKELLSEVMGIKIEDIIDLKIFGKELKYYEKCLFTFCCDNRLSKHKDSLCKSINVYELVHECKKWAFKNGYEIVVLAYSIKIYKNGYEIYHTNTTLFDLDMFFKACEWVLKKNKIGEKMLKLKGITIDNPVEIDDIEYINKKCCENCIKNKNYEIQEKSKK